MIDTHCHFNDEAFTDLKECLERCEVNNVNKVIIVGFDKLTNLKSLEICKKYSNCYPTIGYHPEVANDITSEDLEYLEELIKNNKIYAIGECGLDYYWVKDNKEKQKWLFRKQIELAIKYELPIVVHSRDAINDTLLILKEYENIKGVMHSYSGSVEMLNDFLAIGFYISVGGVVTFKNAKNIIEVVKKVDINRLLLETDCPYLTPVPFRGKRNESSYIPLIAEKIADIKEISVKEVSDITDENAERLFKLTK